MRNLLRWFGPLFLAVSVLAQTTPVTQVDNWTALKALPITAAGAKMSVLMKGRVTANDGGGGVFFFTPGAGAMDDSGTIVTPNVGTGAWFRQYSGPLNLMWFGAVTGGVTDCLAAFNSALAVVPTGGKIFAPRGKYLFTGTISPSVNFVTVEGESPQIKAVTSAGNFLGETVFVFNNSTVGFDLTSVNANGAILKNFVIDGGNTLTNGVKLGAGSILIDGVTVGNCVHGVYGSAIPDADLINCAFSANTYGARIAGDSTTISFVNCQFTDNTFGLVVTGGRDISLNYCVFEHNKDIGLDIEGVSGTPCYNLSSKDCWFENNNYLLTNIYQVKISADVVGTAHHITFDNPTFSMSNSEGGLYVDKGDHITVNQPLFLGLTTVTTNRYGVFTSNATDIKLYNPTTSLAYVFTNTVVENMEHVNTVNSRIGVNGEARFNTLIAGSDTTLTRTLVTQAKTPLWVDVNQATPTIVSIENDNTDAAATAELDFITASGTAYLRYARSGDKVSLGHNASDVMTVDSVNTVAFPGSKLTINSSAYTWPGSVGAAATYLYDAAGNGTLSWATIGGTISGLTATAIPYASSASALANSPISRLSSTDVGPTTDNGSTLGDTTHRWSGIFAMPLNASSNTLSLYDSSGTIASVFGPAGGLTLGGQVPPGAGNLNLSGNVQSGGYLALGATAGAPDVYLYRGGAGILAFGGTGANFPAFILNGTSLRLIKANNSAYGNWECGSITFNGSQTPGTDASYILGDATHRVKYGFFGGSTETSSNPVITENQTFNSGGVTFTGHLMNITDTASASASLFQDWQVGGASKASLRKDGTLQLSAGTTSLPSLSLGGDTTTGWIRPSANVWGFAFSGVDGLRLDPNNGIRFRSDYGMAWASSTGYGANDVTLFRDGTATLQLTGSWEQTGKTTKYNNIATVSGGVPAEYATIDSTGLTANVGATTLYAVPASAGMYRISAYLVTTTAASVSSTMPNAQIVYTDSDSNTSVTLDVSPILGAAGLGQSGLLTANTVGTVFSGTVVVYVKASTTIQYQTVNYASTAAGMAYALRMKLEAL